MTAPVVVDVFEPDGATLITNIPRAAGVKWLDELNGVGAGQFDLHLDDATLGTYPQIITPFNIVKVKPTGALDYVYAWQLEEVTPAQVTAAENAGRWATLKGRHVRSILDTAIVTGSTDKRVFDFSSPVGAWYVSADWDTPVGVAWEDDTTARAGNPREWPDPTAEWIWSTDPESTAPAERNWFRGEFTLASDTDVTIWAAADNSMSLRLNGEKIITSQDPTGLFNWKELGKWTGTLPAGTHLLAAWVDNAASTALNPGGFICTVGTTDSQGELDTVILRTGNAAWTVHAAANPPGWRAAQILIQLLTEAQADGYLPGVTWDFDDTTDSDGSVWGDLQDVEISTSTDLLTVTNFFAGTVLDIDMTPDLVLRAFVRKGNDLTPWAVYTEGVDVTGLVPTARYGQIRNVAQAQYGGGWIGATDNTSITAYGKRAMGLSLGDAGTADQAQQIADDSLIDLAWPQLTIPLEATSVVGPQPWDDFNLGDTISVPGFLTGQIDARVLSISTDVMDNHLRFVIDLYPET